MRHFLSYVGLLIAAAANAAGSSSTLPDGTEFPFWEKPLQFSKTYHVDNQAEAADDAGPGTSERPLKTVNRAAQVLQPGERVVIAAGVYRESVQPARGGTGPDAMISYEAAPGAQVIIKGSAVVTDWKPSEGWNIGVDPKTNAPVKAWELRLDPKLFPSGYIPFQVGRSISFIKNKFSLF